MTRILVILLIIMPVHIFAQIGGTTVYRFLDLEMTALSTATGNKNITQQTPSSHFYNPALLSAYSKYATFSYTNYFAGINWGLMLYNFDSTKYGFFSVGANYVYYGQFTATDETGEIIGNFSASDMLLCLSWAYKYDSLWSFGVNFKPVFSHYENYFSTGISTDFGVYYNNDQKLLTAAVVFRNLGFQIKPYVSESYERLPFDIMSAISIGLKHAPFRFTIWADNLNHWNLMYEVLQPYVTVLDTLNQTKPSKIDLLVKNAILHTGFSADIIISKNFFIKIGYNYRRRQELKFVARTGLAGFSTGFGIKTSKFTFDYGFAKYTPAQGVHTFTLAVNTELFYKKF